MYHEGDRITFLIGSLYGIPLKNRILQKIREEGEPKDASGRILPVNQFRYGEEYLEYKNSRAFVTTSITKVSAKPGNADIGIL
jgi:hypothetical protein